MYWLESQIWLPGQIEEVFAFFSEAKNLQKITPGWLDFQVAGISTPNIEASTRIDYRLKIRGIPIRWQSEITIWEPPCRFVDRQVTGPYAHWNHEHCFEQQNGGTLCSDRVEYLPPGGPLLAPIINRLVVGQDVRKIFQYRRDRLEELFPEPNRHS